MFVMFAGPSRSASSIIPKWTESCAGNKLSGPRVGHLARLREMTEPHEFQLSFHFRLNPALRLDQRFLR
jgi:hypothetical protein